MSEEGDPEAEQREDRTGIVLDYLPHGRSDDDRPQYQKSALAQVVDVEDFGLYEVALAEDADVTIGDELVVEPPGEEIETVRRIDYDELSGGASSELEHVVEEVLSADEERLVEFYNEAGPVTLRLHQLNLLPGIGDKLRDDILDARKRRPFESVEDIEERIDGLHDPRGTVVERIFEEFRDEDVKYKLFVRADQES